jgi:hypothetical protein
MASNETTPLLNNDPEQPTTSSPGSHRKPMGFFSQIIHDFGEFVSQGNVVDLAIGVIMGGAFSAIVTSVVEDLFSPFLSLCEYCHDMYIIYCRIACLLAWQDQTITSRSSNQV